MAKSRNYNTTATSATKKLSKTLSKLSAQLGSTIRTSSGKRSTSSSKTTATSLLAALGCTVSSQKIDYSLLDDQTDRENIENENIDDSKKYSRIKANTTSATDKFANTSDPFYELDDDISERVKVARASITEAATVDLTSLALSFSKM
tara:strand:- start:81 stop:524 length:444 start_codon:yes stop_codon:yes gene_type:complete